MFQDVLLLWSVAIISMLYAMPCHSGRRYMESFQQSCFGYYTFHDMPHIFFILSNVGSSNFYILVDVARVIVA